jgi:hypothetical protein
LTVRVNSGSPNSASQPVEIRPSFPVETAAQLPGARIAMESTGALNRQDSQAGKTKQQPAMA